MSHGHPHGHCSDHAHEHEDLERGTMFSLYTKIHIDRVECLNEVTEGSGKEVFKAWENRLNFEKVQYPSLELFVAIVNKMSN